VRPNPILQEHFRPAFEPPGHLGNGPCRSASARPLQKTPPCRQPTPRGLKPDRLVASRAIAGVLERFVDRSPLALLSDSELASRSQDMESLKQEIEQWTSSPSDDDCRMVAQLLMERFRTGPNVASHARASMPLFGTDVNFAFHTQKCFAQMAEAERNGAGRNDGLYNTLAKAQNDLNHVDTDRRAQARFDVLVVAQFVIHARSANAASASASQRV
jgi:hypothetical protein